MIYQFPRIECLDDIIPHIEGNESFKVGTSLLSNGKKIYSVSYNFVIPGITFPPVVDLRTSILRECRGLLFNEDRSILARRFHKFFNYGELDETKDYSNLPLKIDQYIPIGLPSIGEFVLEDKIDGSMLSTHFIDGQLYFFSKRGYTEVSVKAEKDFQNLSEEGREFILEITNQCMTKKLTPIWEYTSPSQLIVINHRKPQFMLLTIRENISGLYIGNGAVHTVAPKFDSWKDLASYISNLENVEGYVARHTDTGHRIKFKTKWYLVRHRAIDLMKSPHSLLNIILEDKLDDIIGSFQDQTKEAVIRYAQEVQHFIISTFDRFEQYWATLKDEQFLISSDQKELKRVLAPHAQHMNSVQKVVFFNYLDGHNVRESAIKCLLKHTVSRTKLNSINDQFPEFPKLKWSGADVEE